MLFSRLIAILFLSALLTTPAWAQGYQLTGTFSGLPDGTWLYLRDRDTIDSCQVTNQSFRMSGHLPDPAIQVILHTPNFTHYVVFWLENTRIQLAVEAGQARKGIVTRLTGSATEADNQRLAVLQAPVRHQTDSLNRALAATQDSGTRKTVLAQLQRLKGQSQQLDQAWIRAHPASSVAAELVNRYATSWGKTTTQALYQGLSPAMKATRYGREIGDYLTLYQGLQIGDRYVDFEQPNPAGNPIKLSGVTGKYTLLDFWASWCGPCLEENKVLKESYARYQPKGFAVLGVSLDGSKASWVQTMTRSQLPWANVSDLRGDKNKAALLYGISGIPDNFLIDPNGVIIARNLRGKKLEETLQQLLP